MTASDGHFENVIWKWETVRDLYTSRCQAAGAIDPALLRDEVRFLDSVVVGQRRRICNSHQTRRQGESLPYEPLGMGSLQLASVSNHLH